MDDCTTRALKDITQLVGVSQALREMNTEFRKAPDLDFEVASPLAMGIIKFSRRAAEGLLAATMRGAGRREEAVTAARQAYAKGLARSILRAQALSKMEAEAIRPLGGAGNFIERKVLLPLQQLVA